MNYFSVFVCFPIGSYCNKIAVAKSSDVIACFPYVLIEVFHNKNSRQWRTQVFVKAGFIIATMRW